MESAIAIAITYPQHSAHCSDLHGVLYTDLCCTPARNSESHASSGDHSGRVIELAPSSNADVLRSAASSQTGDL